MKSSMKVLSLALLFTLVFALLMSCGLLLLPFTVQQLLPYSADLPNIDGLYKKHAQDMPLSQKEIREKFSPYTHIVYTENGAIVSYFTKEEYLLLSEERNKKSGLRLEEILYLLNDSYAQYSSAHALAVYGMNSPIIPARGYMDLPYTEAFEEYERLKREILLISAYRIAAFDERLVFFDEKCELLSIENLFKNEARIAFCALLLDEPFNEGYLEKVKGSVKTVKREEGRLLLIDLKGSVELFKEGTGDEFFASMIADHRPYESEEFNTSASRGMTLSYCELSEGYPHVLWEKEIPKDALSSYYNALNQKEYTVHPFEQGSCFEGHERYFVVDLQNGKCLWIAADYEDLDSREEDLYGLILDKDVIPEIAVLENLIPLSFVRLIYDFAVQ